MSSFLIAVCIIIIGDFKETKSNRFAGDNAFEPIE